MQRRDEETDETLKSYVNLWKRVIPELLGWDGRRTDKWIQGWIPLASNPFFFTEAPLNYVAGLLVPDLVLSLNRDRAVTDIYRALGRGQDPKGEFQVFDAGLARRNLGNLEALAVLYGSYDRPNDRTLAELARLDNVRALNLMCSDITDSGLSHLAALQDLEVLSVGQTRTTDEGAKKLAGLKGLRELDLDRTQVSDVGLGHLRGIVHLEKLGLYKTAVSDAGLCHLLTMDGLSSLDLGATRVTDNGMGNIAELRALRWLSLAETKVGDGGIEKCVVLQNLQDLNLNDAAVTDEGAARLKRGIPALKYVFCVHWARGREKR